MFSFKETPVRGGSMDSNFSISRFCIDGFLRKYDVDIEFPGRINIMVGENGLGKNYNIKLFVLCIIWSI